MSGHNKEQESKKRHHISITISWRSLFKSVAAGIGLLMATGFVLTNILYSHNVHEQYYEFVNEDPETVGVFLQKTRSLPQYWYFAQEMGETITRLEDRILVYDREREAVITQLEDFLQRNDKARDVLYALSILYEQDGNMDRAGWYRERAKMVDPEVGEK